MQTSSLQKKLLMWRSYTAKAILPITWRVELINNKEFAQAVLDENIKVFVVHISYPSPRSKMTIHLGQEAWIALLLTKEIIVVADYSDFTDMFLKELAEVLPKYTGINKYSIKLEEGK